MGEEKNKEIKDEVIGAITSETKDAAENLMKEAKKQPWYKRILFYVLALLAGGVYYIASVFGDDIWERLYSFLSSMM